MTECSELSLGGVIRMALDCVNWNSENSSQSSSQSSYHDLEDSGNPEHEHIPYMSPSQLNQDLVELRPPKPDIELRLIPIESEPPKVFQVKNLSDGYPQEIGRIFMIFPIKLRGPLIIMTQESPRNNFESFYNQNVYAFINEEERRRFVTTVYNMMNNLDEEKDETRR